MDNDWEVRVTSANKKYFVNHKEKSTQFTDPRLVANVNLIKQILRGRMKTGEPNNNLTPVNSNALSAETVQNANSIVVANVMVCPSSNVPSNTQPQLPPPNKNKNKSAINEMPLNHRDLDFNIQTTTVQRKNLVQKMSTLRKELSGLQPQSGHCKLEVSRKDIFEESFIAVRKMKPKDLRKRLMIKFKGEEGLGRCRCGS